jgi:hypothetical protein
VLTDIFCFFTDFLRIDTDFLLLYFFPDVVHIAIGVIFAFGFLPIAFSILRALFFCSSNALSFSSSAFLPVRAKSLN